MLGGFSTFFTRSSVLTIGVCEGIGTSDMRLRRLRSGPLTVAFVGFSVGVGWD